MVIDYQKMIDTAMIKIVHQILEHISRYGVSGEQCFYINFNTAHSGVQLSKVMRVKYPEQITIVLQHQYSNLIVNENEFRVDLSFNGQQETVVVPFTAIIEFVDVSVNFSLQFLHKSLTQEIDLYEDTNLTTFSLGESEPLGFENDLEEQNSKIKNTKKQGGNNIIDFQQFKKKLANKHE